MRNRAKSGIRGTDRASLPASLLAWYGRAGRDLPWRAKGRGRPDPYRVWLSEIMLQQTSVAAVIPYFEKFLRRWSGIGALAAAPLEDVLQAWAGLGYYARARNLHKCARMVMADHGGQFPADEAGLRRLPGIGEYTAAAISAIAFARPANVVDGNVERVMARLWAVDQPLPKARKRLQKLAGDMAPVRRPGDYAQALMDLGATLCTPRKPACSDCPWADHCRAHALGAEEAYPGRVARKPKPVRHGIAYWIEKDDAVLLQRRPERGLLGGMMSFPGSDWVEGRTGDRAVAQEEGGGRLLPGEVRHTFTHFHLVLRVSVAQPKEPPAGQWVPISRLDEIGLPSVMQKIARHALDAVADGG